MQFTVVRLACHQNDCTCYLMSRPGKRTMTTESCTNTCA